MEVQFFSHGITPIPFFVSIYLLVYLFAYTAFFRNWGPKLRREASSCVMSLAHGTPAVLLSIYSLLSSSPQYPGDLASPNTPFQNFVLEYSTSYFFMDLIHYLVFIPNEVLFIVHHIATLFVLITCRYLVNHGAFPMLVLLILAEITSACQNVWTIAGFRRSDVPAAAKLYESLSPFFYVLYSIARGVLAPMFVYKLVVFYLSGGGDGVIPMWAWVSWIIVISSGILVSLVWILNLWIALFRERSKQKQV